MIVRILGFLIFVAMTATALDAIHYMWRDIQGTEPVGKPAFPAIMYILLAAAGLWIALRPKMRNKTS